MSEFYKLSIKEKLEGLKSGSFSSLEITNSYLERIKSLDNKINSFITLTESEAIESAKESDKRYKNKENLPLDGIPIAHKDIFCTKGVLTTCGSKMLENFLSPYSSTVTRKFEESGSIVLGKTNMDEFAMGSSNETSFFGPVMNPWKLNHVPGGSSGGSAACVSAGFASGATATDTGGSIRQPAALCGLTGIKPTYGRVSRYGMIAFASSLDQAGVLTKNAEDAAYMLSIMSGHDSKDSTSLNVEVPDYTKEIKQDIKGMKIGLPKQFFSMSLPSYVEKSIEESLKVFKKLGVEIKDIDLPHIDLSLPVYYVIAPAECSANLSRYDGVKFGFRCEDPKNLEDLYMRTREEGFGSEVKRRILIGTYALSAGYYDAYYLKAQKCRRLIAEDFKKAFKDVDLILSPTAPDTAFSLGEKSTDPVEMYKQDIFTIPANLAGLPGISIPCGINDGLPLGLQLVSNNIEESKLLRASHQFQLNTDWHLAWPEMGS
ncbi:MAG: Asp-tRNA(Asn)/Glu-tRNA(Gln) amidotransferase GatCAB subunit A [Gammaproteobacteria bacterium]|nr:Asp-tRNA(Asn)/Glu-tRNA(Gln) amidotransferase GatCAB subunit A [Gammaproteobacteria bacterium]|tara:strand:- start:566 stop:2029 length:1464 start_codon:yes stop_codon:yes gene_type:complete